MLKVNGHTEIREVHANTNISYLFKSLEIVFNRYETGGLLCDPRLTINCT
jgi:hypothetical protein